MLKSVALRQEFERIWEKVLNGENFAFIRNGDGERRLMEGASFEAQEGWSTGQCMTSLGRALKDSISIDAPNYYIGISCPCCDADAYKWYLRNIPGENYTFANLWVNTNYGTFIKQFSQLEREAVVIANYRALGKPIGKLNILDYYCVSDDCVSFWEQEAEEMINCIIQKYGNKEKLLFAVSAGPMSGPIIARLYRNNPNNCYLDFGSSIDSFYWGKITRPYMKPGELYAMQQCWMYAPTRQRDKVEKLVDKFVKHKQRKRVRQERKEKLRILPQLLARKLIGDKRIEKIKRRLGK